MKRKINSVKIYPKLKELFGDGLKPELEEVIIFHKNNEVFYEMIFSEESGIENIQYNLGFITDGKNKLFDTSKGIDKNTADFLKMEGYTLLVAADEMFTDTMQKVIEDSEYPDEINSINSENTTSNTNYQDDFLNIAIENSNIIKLKDILVTAEKEPLYDNDGYSEYRLVFNQETPIIPLENYNLIFSNSCFIKSRLYYRYLDQKTIVFRVFDEKMLWFDPKKDESICIKGSGLYAYKIKNDLEELYDLEYVYIHLMHPKFYEQFKEAISSENILEGWIPNASYEKQVEFSKRMREKTIKDISDAQIILGIA